MHKLVRLDTIVEERIESFKEEIEVASADALMVPQSRSRSNLWRFQVWISS
jgi:hypothetical protein